MFELLVKRVWHRTLARIRRTHSGDASPDTSATRSSPANRLPREIVEMIIAYLIYDMHSLRACTLTCYSWYIAAVPHLHHTLTIMVGSWDRKYRWPNPIRYMHVLGLLPLVRELRFHGKTYLFDRFSPQLFNCCVLRQFFTLSNVQKLMIEHLDIPKFMPRIQRYFRYFLPTVQSLVLKEPRGSLRQLIYFIGLFRHLQDLELLDIRPSYLEEPAEDPTLIPPFVPPLRGWLKLTNFTKVHLLKEMIDLFGGIRFRYLRLFDVSGMRLLLGACANTLEIVVLDPADPRGEQHSLKGTEAPANDFAARSSLREFDFSRNKSLRTLEVPASSVRWTWPDGRSPSPISFLKHVLSTITSTTFLRVIVLYRDHNFPDVEPWHSRPPFRELLQAERAEKVSSYRWRFRVLREVRKVRDFQVELCVCVWGSLGEEPVRILEDAVAEEAKKGFSGFFSNPPVKYSPQRSR